MGMFRNCARNPRSWCGTTPSTPSDACAESPPCGCGDGGALILRLFISDERGRAAVMAGRRTHLGAAGARRAARLQLRRRWRRGLVSSPCTSGRGSGPSTTASQSPCQHIIPGTAGSTHVRRGNDIVAIIAPKPLALRLRRARTMSHDKERIESKRSIEYDLALRRAEHGREPAALARVHQEEHRIVRVEESLERRDIRLRLRDRRGRDRVPRHRDAQAVPGRVLLGVSRAGRGDGERGRTTPGKIFWSRAAAHAALGFPPLRQSSNSKSGCRTGFENDTRAESTSVIVRTPQPYRRVSTSLLESEGGDAP